MSIKVGFIGAGQMAQGHLASLSKLSRLHIAAIYDIDQARAKEAADKYDAKVYESADDVINSGEIDAMFVCTPQFAREHIEEKAAKKGIHLFVEKPLGLDLETLRVKERIVKESGVITSAGYCLRYLDTVQKAKAFLRDKQVDLVSAFRFGGMYSPTWWKQLPLSGGQFVDQTTHQVDMIRYLVGEIYEVYAQFERRALHRDDPNATIYDVGSVCIKMASGAVGSISNTVLAPQYPRAEVELLGSNFCLRLSNNGKNLTIIDDQCNITEASNMNFYFEQDKRFIDAVASGDRSGILCDYSDALKTLQVTLAANQSVEQKKPVIIDTFV